MILAGVMDGLVPRSFIWQYERYRRERQKDRSLLFVAATRSRDALKIFWRGNPSPFLATLDDQVRLRVTLSG